MDHVQPPPPGATYWDRLAERLQAQRALVGDPGYGEIASRIASAREAAGTDPAAARVARSTVFDLFRTGRSRINLDLYAEAAVALGADRDDVARWLVDLREPTVAEPEPTVPEPGPAPQGVADLASHLPPRRLGVRLASVFAIACIGVNLLGLKIAGTLGLTIYLDMIGTAIAAFVLGPWRGAAVGAATNVLGVLVAGTHSLPFLVVNVVGALVWGYGARNPALTRSLLGFLRLNVRTAVACSACAVPILIHVYDGAIGVGHQGLTGRIHELTGSGQAAVAVANLVTSTVDKLLSGFIALAVVASLPGVLRRGVRIVGVEPVVD